MSDKILTFEGGEKVVRDAVPGEIPTLVVTSEMVNRERTLRIEAGTIVALTGGIDVALQGREQDRDNLIGLAMAAQLYIAAGDILTETKYRDRDNVDHMLTPPQIIELFSMAIAWIDGIYNASWVLKDMDPIPQDFTDDGYW